MRRVATFVPAPLSWLCCCAPLLGARRRRRRPGRRGPVKFILTLGPGSGTDIGGRLLADRLTKKWGQPVVIENRPGGDGIVAINAFVSAKDDHILLLSPTSSFIAHPWMHDNRPYKAEDLAPIARVSNTVIGISVPNVMPVNSLGELVALAKSKPGELNWAGVTGALDFNFAGWLKVANLDMKKVPYRNPVEAANDLATNRVQVYESAVAIAQPQLQAGNIKLLAVVNTARAPVYPGHPDRGGGRPAGADHRRAGRPVRPADHADGAAPEDRRRHQGGDGKRRHHQGSAERHRAALRPRRAGGVRQVDRRASAR